MLWMLFSHVTLSLCLVVKQRYLCTILMTINILFDLLFLGMRAIGNILLHMRRTGPDQCICTVHILLKDQCNMVRLYLKRLSTYSRGSPSIFLTVSSRQLHLQIATFYRLQSPQ